MKRLILNKDGSYFYLWKYIHALGGFNFVITDTSNLPVSISEDKILESHDFLNEYFAKNSLALPYLNCDHWGYNPILLKFSLNKDLIDLGLWNEGLKDQIIAYQGSIQRINTIPNYIRDLYKTTQN